MIIWLLLLFCASPVALAIIEGKNFKSKNKKIRNKAWIIFFIITFMQALQFTTSYIQETNNNNINDSLSLLHTNDSLMGEKIDNLLVTHKTDSISLIVLTDTLASTNELIKKSNLIYKNGKLVPKVVNSQFNLPNPVFNAPAQLGNGNTQNN